jgi:hypothetical protein
MPKLKATNTKRGTPGPKPEVIKINGSWQKAVTESFKKKKPTEGWSK